MKPLPTWIKSKKFISLDSYIITKISLRTKHQDGFSHPAHDKEQVHGLYRVNYCPSLKYHHGLGQSYGHRCWLSESIIASNCSFKMPIKLKLFRKEFDEPLLLLENPKSFFYYLVEQTGTQGAAELTLLAQEVYVSPTIVFTTGGN